jgi:hypothetical protein
MSSAKLLCWVFLVFTDIPTAALAGCFFAIACCTDVINSGDDAKIPVTLLEAIGSRNILRFIGFISAPE